MSRQTLDLLLLAHAGATLFMVGLIWFVQIVHYPLFGRVGRGNFIRYEEQHARRTGWVVAGPMVLELILAIAWVWIRGGWIEWAGLLLLGGIWASTAVWQVPMHRRLAAGYDEAAHRWLVRSNWVRTAGWSLRGIIALAMMAPPTSAGWF
jgi:hypothetical protein